jgi:hypothetical protein
MHFYHQASTSHNGALGFLSTSEKALLAQNHATKQENHHLKYQEFVL